MARINSDPSSKRAAMSSTDMTFQTRRYQMPDGIEVVADVGGDPQDPPVIFMHGGGQTRYSWDGVMRILIGRGFHVINLDARGHGESDWSPDGDYALTTLTADLHAILATLEQKPALVGASMGAATGMVAVGHSQAPIAQALVLVDLVPRVEQAGANKIAEFMRAYPDGFETLEQASDAVAEYYPHRPRPKDPSGLMKNLRRRDDGRLHWHWDPKFVDRPQGSEPPQMEKQLQEAADGVSIPTLLIRGLQSDIVSDAGVADFKTRVPQLEVVDISGAGHMVVGDKNDVFNQGLIEFLEHHMKT